MSDWEADIARFQAELDANHQRIRERRQAEADRMRAAQAAQRKRLKAHLRVRISIWWVNTWVRQLAWRIRND